MDKQSRNILIFLFLAFVLLMGQQVYDYTRIVAVQLQMKDDADIQFRDSGLFIKSDADGKIQYSSDGSGDDDHHFTGNVTMNHNLTMSGSAIVIGGSRQSGTAAFTTTDTADTVVVTGATASSIFVVAINDLTPVANDLLGWDAATDTLFVNRPAGTTSALAYSWIRLD